MIITVNDRQSLFDIALIALGGVAGVFDLARRNNISVTATLRDGLPIAYEMADVVSTNVRRAYALQDIAPATDIHRDHYLHLLHITDPRPQRPPRSSVVLSTPIGYVDKLSEIIADLQAGKVPPPNLSSQNLSRLFSNPFDETFA